MSNRKLKSIFFSPPTTRWWFKFESLREAALSDNQLEQFRNQFQMKYSNKVDEQQQPLSGHAAPHLKSSIYVEQVCFRRFSSFFQLDTTVSGSSVEKKIKKIKVVGKHLIVKATVWRDRSRKSQFMKSISGLEARARSVLSRVFAFPEHNIVGPAYEMIYRHYNWQLLRD